MLQILLLFGLSLGVIFLIDILTGISTALVLLVQLCAIRIFCLAILLLLLTMELSVHIVHLVNSIDFSGGHNESLVVQKGDNTFLREHQLDHSFSFMLVKLVLFVMSVCAGYCATGCARLRRVD